MFIPDPNKAYSMPPWFGGLDFDPNREILVNNIRALNFTYTTDGNRLANYLPEGFELLRPELTIQYNQLRGVSFMHGASYNLLQVTVPTRFNGKRDKLEAPFPLVVWENKTRPIIGGREEDGQPKIYADIEDLQLIDNEYITNASYQGNTFISLEMYNIQPVSKQQLEQLKAASLNSPVFGYRYIPKVGAPGADLIQPIFYPQSMTIKGAWTGKGDVQWTKLPKAYQIKEVISYYDIIKQLAELPVYSRTTVLMATGPLNYRVYQSRVLK